MCCLRGDLGTYFLSFFDGGGWLEVSTTPNCVSEYHCGQPMTYLTVPSGGWFDMVY
jgi:hypothetical protein